MLDLEQTFDFSEVLSNPFLPHMQSFCYCPAGHQIWLDKKILQSYPSCATWTRLFEGILSKHTLPIIRPSIINRIGLTWQSFAIKRSTWQSSQGQVPDCCNRQFGSLVSMSRHLSHCHSTPFQDGSTLVISAFLSSSCHLVLIWRHTTDGRYGSMLVVWILPCL